MIMSNHSMLILVPCVVLFCISFSDLSILYTQENGLTWTNVSDIFGSDEQHAVSCSLWNNELTNNVLTFLNSSKFEIDQETERLMLYKENQQFVSECVNSKVDETSQYFHALYCEAWFRSMVTGTVTINIYVANRYFAEC